MVECNLPKVKVASSILVSRFKYPLENQYPIQFFLLPELGDFLTRLASIPLIIGLRAFRPYHQIDKAFKALSPLI